MAMRIEENQQRILWFSVATYQPAELLAIWGLYWKELRPKTKRFSLVR